MPSSSRRRPNVEVFTDIIIGVLVVTAFPLIFGFVGYQLYWARQPVHNIEQYRCMPNSVDGYVFGVGEIVQMTEDIDVEVGSPDPLDPFWPIPSDEARIVSGVPQQFRHPLMAVRLREGYSGVWAIDEEGSELWILKHRDSVRNSYSLTLSGVHGTDRLRVSGSCVRYR